MTDIQLFVPIKFTCTFCGGEHQTEEGKEFWGVPFRICPNIPEEWGYVIGPDRNGDFVIGNGLNE